jgi:hypothetical protein
LSDGPFQTIFSIQTTKRHAALARERHASLMLLVMTVSFCIAWTPYTVISLMSMFGSQVSQKKNLHFFKFSKVQTFGAGWYF